MIVHVKAEKVCSLNKGGSVC